MAASLCSQTKSCTNVIVAQNMTCRKFRLRVVRTRVASMKMDVMSCRLDSITVSVFVNIG